MVAKSHATENSITLLKAPASDTLGVVITRSVCSYRLGMVMSVKNIRGNGKISATVIPEQLNVYPNPTPMGSNLHIAWNKKEHGEHSLQLFSQTGQLVFRRDVYIDQEARVLSIDLPNVPAGSYFLRITSVQTNKSYSEKIIIQ
jgi:hypothetical protein